jgi:hypothetical protein
MNYEINIALHGHHYFATATRSMNFMTQEDAITMYDMFKEKFPRTDGFTVSLSVSTTQSEYLRKD